MENFESTASDGGCTSQLLNNSIFAYYQSWGTSGWTRDLWFRRSGRISVYLFSGTQLHSTEMSAWTLNKDRQGLSRITVVLQLWSKVTLASCWENSGVTSDSRYLPLVAKPLLNCDGLAEQQAFLQCTAMLKQVLTRSYLPGLLYIWEIPALPPQYQESTRAPYFSP